MSNIVTSSTEFFGAYTFPRGPKDKILTKTDDGWIPRTPAIVPRKGGLPYYCTDTNELFCWDSKKGNWELLTGGGLSLERLVQSFDQVTIKGAGTEEDPFRVAEVIQEYDSNKGIWPQTYGYALGSCVHSPSLINGDEISGSGGIEGIYKLMRQNKRIWRVYTPDHLKIGVARAYNPGDFFYIVGFVGSNEVYNGIYYVYDAVISLLVSQTDVKDLKALISNGHIYPMTSGIPGTTNKIQPFESGKQYEKGDLVYVSPDDYYINGSGDRVKGEGFAKFFEALYGYPEVLPEDELNEYDDTTGWALLADVNSERRSTDKVGTLIGFLWYWVDGKACDTITYPDGYLPCDGTSVEKDSYPLLYSVLCKLSSNGTCPFGESELTFNLPKADNQIIYTGVYNG